MFGPSWHALPDYPLSSFQCHSKKYPNTTRSAALQYWHLCSACSVAVVILAWIWHSASTWLRRAPVSRTIASRTIPPMGICSSRQVVEACCTASLSILILHAPWAYRALVPSPGSQVGTGTTHNKQGHMLWPVVLWAHCLNTLRPEQNGHHLADDIC